MKVSNPLTIIAIFSGIAESFATVALVALPPEIQVKFVQFVIWFPVLLVILFFLVLVFKPLVLYAPSDWRDEDKFLTALKVQRSVDYFFSREASQFDNYSKDEMHKLQQALNKSIERNLYQAERECILEYIKEGFTGTSILSGKTGYPPSLVKELIQQLREDKIIKLDKLTGRFAIV
ncbi:ArsR family transcriptional regulator [Vibrio kanaloae]|uniref:ArsR family transcriptional regulator n=1 Tax=Vibrio kanaloae TaxID=170673 RepID=UPI00124920B1|nr:ArsR family transcriptional regulator [Vibrio kanaloae]KAB0458321.1 ArsR family transcriptional regulator [Vibrio kanaloae]